MKTIELRASAKINLSIDVLGKRPDGYHEVAMVMQQIDLWDKVKISYEERTESPLAQVKALGHNVFITSKDPFLPLDERNLAHKAAVLFKKYYPEKTGNIHIDIVKKIPSGAGLGGGSADAAAVLNGLNLLWNINLPPSKLMEMGVQIGADVPFLIMSQVASTKELFRGNENLSTCALAEGIGEKLTPLPPLKASVLLKKPDLFISTAEIYKALDLKKIGRRPDTKQLIEGLYQGNFSKVAKSMENVLEEVAIRRYPIIQEVIDEMKALTGYEKVMMSGSGPVVFALTHSHLSHKNELC